MITFKIKNTEFSYDLNALSRSFFPEKESRVEQFFDFEKYSEKNLENIYPLRCEVDGKLVIDKVFEKGYSKEIVKRYVYDVFANISQKQLPWGILTGIRPTKIPLKMFFESQPAEKIYKDLCNDYYLSERKAKLALDIAKKEYSLIRDLDLKNGYSLYIGIPFCPSICGYCSFSSYAINTYKDKVDAYLLALEKEMKYISEKFKGKRLDTIYVGGGTPTSLNEKQLEKLLNKIKKYFSPENTLEFCIEAGRPDSLNEKKLELLKAAQVTRISVNPQTMKQETLDLLGRKHSVEQFVEAYEKARKIGFDNINMDLIIGLLQENESDFQNTLSRILSMEPDSVTVHTLVIKRASKFGTVYTEEERKGADDKLIEKLQFYSEDKLREKNYQPYYMYRQKNKLGSTKNTNQENVAYAKEGKECLYNIMIMEELETIVAIGAGASSKVVYHDQDRMERIENVKSIDDYINRIDEMIERKKNI